MTSAIKFFLSVSGTAMSRYSLNIGLHSEDCFSEVIDNFCVDILLPIYSNASVNVKLNLWHEMCMMNKTSVCVE